MNGPKGPSMREEPQNGGRIINYNYLSMKTLITKELQKIVIKEKHDRQSIFTTKATLEKDFDPSTPGDNTIIHHKPTKQRTNEQKTETLHFGQALIKSVGNKLNRHTERNLQVDNINHKIYHLLCSPFTHMNAYYRISKNTRVFTKGIKNDAEINKFFGQGDALKIANKFKNKTYDWMPAQRVMKPKPGKKGLRPIDTPTQENRIAQESIRGILEAIYEPEFKELEQNNGYLCTNYGFRPFKSTHDAVKVVKSKGQGVTYVIKGDISKAYNSLDHDVFLAILSRRIRDKKFLQTINQMLKSGIMEKNQLTHNLLGTPQGGIASPLFFNIYMHEFDKFIQNEFIEPIQEHNANKGKKKANPEHKNMGSKIRSLLIQTRNLLPDEKTLAKALSKEIKEIEAKRFKLASHIPETLPKSAVYSRYADDWILAITCTKEEAELYKGKITQYLKDVLKMTLDPVNTKITRIDDGFNFLGFTIQTWSPDQLQVTHKLYKKHNRIQRFKERTRSRKITIIPCSDIILANLLRNKFCQGSEYFPIAKAAWTVLDEYEIVLKFRQTWLGLFNYYHRTCDTTYILNRVSYILKFSCAKTLSYRQKSSITKIFAKYGSNLTIHRPFFTGKGTIDKDVEFTSYSQLRKLPF